MAKASAALWRHRPVILYRCVSHRRRYPRGLQPLRHPVSSLSIGELGWTQIVNFVISGCLILAFAIGLWLMLRPSSFWGPLLIGLMGIGLIGSGIFVTDPLNGYPPDTPLIPI